MKTNELDQLIKSLRTPPSDSLDQRVYALLDSTPAVTAGRVWRRIMRSPITKLAVAAALLAGIFILVSHLRGRETAPPEPEPTVAERAPAQQPTGQDSALQVELARADALYGRDDVAGLLALLETGQYETKVKIAQYLGEIGDASVLSALQTLADQWQGAPKANPFQNAIDAINQRLDEAEPVEEETSAPEAVSTEPETGRVLGEPIQEDWTFTAQGVLSGVITDAQTGEPVAGANVELVGNPYNADTDEHGCYCVEEVKYSGNYKLRIRSKTHLGLGDWADLPVAVLARDKHEIKHFSLQPGCAVDVKVVDEQGQPIAGVTLTASWLGAEQGDRPNRIDLCEAQTDRRGHVTIGAVEPFEVPYRIIACHEDYAPGHIDVTLTDPDATERVQIVLERGVDVQGYAEGSDGLPAEGARICAEPDWWHSGKSLPGCEIGVEGLFTLPHIAAGTYRITGTVAGKETLYGVWHFITQVQLPRPEGEILTLRLPEKSPQSLVSIRGHIVWLSDKKPHSLMVSAERTTQNSGQSAPLSGELESFEIHSLEPGTYTLRFSANGLEERVVEDVVAPTEDLEVVLDYQGVLHLTGSVVDAQSQQPIDAFKARIIKLRTLRGPNYVPNTHWTQCTGGTFDLEAVGPSIYRVQVIADGYAPALSGQINTDEGTATALELTPGGRLEGLVTNAAGDPVSGAMVVPLSTARGNMPREVDRFVTEEGAVQTSDEGRFAFAHLPAGSETLSVTHPDYSPAQVEDVEIVEGQTRRAEDIVLVRGGSVEGFVYDTSGQPLPNVGLAVMDEEAQGSAARPATAVTDANGFYRIEGLPVERFYSLTRQDMGRALGVMRRGWITGAGETTPLDLGGPSTLRGVLRKDGRPLSEMRLVLSAPNRTNSEVFYWNADTDASGFFVARGVPAGRYGLYYRNPAGRHNMIRAAIVDVGTEDVDLGTIDLMTTRITVTLKSPDPTTDLSDWQVALREASHFWGDRAGNVDETASLGYTRIIRDVVPGTYQVVASRDSVQIRKPLIIASADEPVAVDIEIPPATGTVSGAFITNAGQSLIMWNADKTVTASISAANSTYAIEHLPAGHYTIGNYYLTDRAPLLEFVLEEGQRQTVDIDVANWGDELSRLFLFVAGSHGVVLNHANVWLEDARGQVYPAETFDTYRLIAPRGHYRLFVQCEGYESYSETVDLTEGLRLGLRQDPNVRIIRLECR